MPFFESLFGTRRKTRDRESASRVNRSLSAHEAAYLLRAPTALMQLDEAEALTVVRFMQPIRYSAGTTIIRQGETIDTGFMVLVLEGEITVESLMPSRVEPVTVNVVGPGSLIGEMSLVDGAARSASCTASTDVRCAVLDRQALEALIAEQPATAAKLMTAVAQRLAERLRDNRHKLQVYSQLVQTMQDEIEQLMPTPQE
ncbi:MAG TPA: cyclic nucleotide-binding domain-containing protein [Hydrogenophaga sp.]|nr:cyclic nucleotide-binding domain-containing protein [Hydrogenophaga sp.]